MKENYLKKSDPFIISEILGHKDTCSICKREFESIDYEFFNEGASTHLHIDSKTKKRNLFIILIDISF